MIYQIIEYIRLRDPRRKFFKEIPDGSKVLDMGCGEGKCANEIALLHPAIEIHGIDVIEERRVSPRIIYTKHDLRVLPLPYADGQFDVVILVHVLEHIENPFLLAKELRRVLRLEGRLYVETPNWSTLIVPSLGMFREQHNPFNFYDDPTHVKPWSKQGLFELINSQCDLTVGKVGTVRNWLRMPFDPIIMIIGLFLKRRDYIVSAFWNLYGWRIYCTGRKEKI
jgi:SAM-dependent methyltransferase